MSGQIWGDVVGDFNEGGVMKWSECNNRHFGGESEVVIWAKLRKVSFSEKKLTRLGKKKGSETR